MTKRENLVLKSKLKKYEEMIKNLMKKLQISLVKYEELKKSKETGRERILNFLREIKEKEKKYK